MWDRETRRGWTSGPWSLELRDDELADIHYNGRRVLRSIRAVVRDHDWATAALVVDRIRETDTTLSLHVRSQGFGSSFAGVVRVEARSSGLVVLCDLESAATYRTNRTGLVVLHPWQIAGAELHVTHTDGRAESSRFPAAISPHQPVFDIAGLAWEDEDLEIDVRFDGDVFEMEDQRNWSDASFKTYSRPLARPFPYTVAAGERVVQRIEIAVRVAGGASGEEPAAPARVELTPTRTRFPDVLVAASTAPDPAPAGLAPIGHGLVVELDLGSTNWRAALARALHARRPVDLRLVLPPDDVDRTLDELAALLTSADILRVAAFDPALHVTDATAAAAVRGAVSRAGLNVPVAGGARSHFTEYNREHARIPADLDGIVIATAPLFHSLDTEQLIESLEIQRLIARQAVQMAAGVPVHIGPIALRPRFNNVATAPAPTPTRDDLTEGYGAEFTGVADPRQPADELAAWTIASSAALAVPGVAGISWFEEWGSRGIRGSDGRPTPAFEAVAALAALEGTLLTGDSPDGLVWATGARSDDGSCTVLVANLDSRRRSITVEIGGTPHEVDLEPTCWTTITAVAP